MRVIELVGLPGSGKSTVAAEAVRRLGPGTACLEYRDLMPLDRRRPLTGLAHGLAMAWMLAARPAALAPLVRGLAAADPRQRRRLRKYLDLTLRARRHRDRGRLAILDQGPIQALTSILVEGPEPSARGAERLVRVAARLWLPDVVAHLELDPGAAAARLLGRPAGGSFFDTLEPDRVAELYRRGSAVVERVVELVEAEGGVRVVRLRGEDPAEANAERIARLAACESV